jgi:hypothetical protein
MTLTTVTLFFHSCIFTQDRSTSERNCVGPQMCMLKTGDCDRTHMAQGVETVSTRKKNFFFLSYRCSSEARIVRCISTMVSKFPKSHLSSRSVHTNFRLPRKLKEVCFESFLSGVRKTLTTKSSDFK